MKRSATLSLGEFRRLTQDLPDNAVIMIVSSQVQGEALAVRPYYFETSLDAQGVFLLEEDISESVCFEE